MKGNVWLWGNGLPDKKPEFPEAWKDGMPEEGDAVVVWGTRPLPQERSGICGPSGWNGVSSDPGVSGVCSESGVSGTFGAIGASGASGASGALGVSDASGERSVERGLTMPALSGAGRPLVLNAHAASFAALSAAELHRRLGRAGVPAAELASRHLRQPGPGLPEVRAWRAERVYIAELFHLRPIGIMRRQSAGIGAGVDREVDPSSPLHRRLAKLAAKALYAAGLDNGIVELAAAPGGGLAVIGLRAPGNRELQAHSWLAALCALRSELRAAADRPDSCSGRGVLIGADPEFLLLSETGKVVSAARYLAGGAGVGCDSVVVGGRVLQPLAELRPAPARTPEQLADNVRMLLLRAAALIQGGDRLLWAAGGMPVPGFALGGHIHLSGVPFTSRLLRQLDSYLAMPMALVESQDERSRRPRYGSLGDFRLQPHGGFEYRTLPSWLVSPAAAKAAFALALLCARESDSLHFVPAEDERYVQAYYEGDKSTLRECLDPLAECMARTRSYRELAAHIEPLLEAARWGRPWNAKADLRLKWRVPPFA